MPGASWILLYLWAFRLVESPVCSQSQNDTYKREWGQLIDNAYSAKLRSARRSCSFCLRGCSRSVVVGMLLGRSG